MDLNKRIQDVDGKIRAITDEAADYAENLKTFIENIEINVFLPKLASNLSQEINNILRIVLQAAVQACRHCESKPEGLLSFCKTLTL